MRFTCKKKKVPVYKMETVKFVVVKKDVLKQKMHRELDLQITVTQYLLPSGSPASPSYIHRYPLQVWKSSILQSGT